MRKKKLRDQKGDSRFFRPLIAFALTLALTIPGPGRSVACSVPVPFAAARPAPLARSMQVYLDGSGSMAGYVAGSTIDVKPLGDVIELLRRRATQQQSGVQFYSFGSKIAPVAAGDVSRYATTAPYTCKRCDNKESHIDVVLSQIASKDPKSLNIVISDFWLDNHAFIGSPQIALGGPLTDMLQQGRAIGLLGIRAPFKGMIYDFPKGRPYGDAAERALFVLIIGPQADVTATYKALINSNSPAMRSDRRRFSYFSQDLGQVRASPQRLVAEGGGANRSALVRPERLPNVDQFALNRDTATAQHGRIEADFDAGEAMMDGAVWSGDLKASTRVWRLEREGDLGPSPCGPRTWLEVAPLAGAWKKSSPTKAHFTLSPATARGLLPGYAYFVQGSLGVKQVKTPSPADDWMRAWSFDADSEDDVRRRRSPFFPTLNLADLAASMEAALASATPSGGDRVKFGFVVTIRQ